VAEPFMFPSPDEPPLSQSTDFDNQPDGQAPLDDQETFDGTPINHQHTEL